MLITTYIKEYAMNPWGIMNDWQRFEVDERVERYGRLRLRRRDAGTRTVGTTFRPGPRTTPALRREDVAACA
ncbi:MAG TPA: hypothetical protein VFU98_07315 [Microlunatus sp.]|nr:hypothetical protein [Microlunatus sp.]